MHEVTPSYLLLEPQPGELQEVLEELSGMPGVEATQELFGSQKIAARLEVDGDLDEAADEIESLDTVWACLYSSQEEDTRRPLHATG